MRAHSPDPAVLELGPERIHGPPRHLRAWIHVSVKQKGGASAGAAQTPDRLPALLRRILRMEDLHHFDVEADVRHRLGVESAISPSCNVGLEILIERCSRSRIRRSSTAAMAGAVSMPARIGDLPIQQSVIGNQARSVRDIRLLPLIGAHWDVALEPT